MDLGTLVFTNFIPSKFLCKQAQIVPEEQLGDRVEMFKDALPYVLCQLQSTIQHEAAHRTDESTRNKELLEKARAGDLQRNKDIMPFSQFALESRVEPTAERAEESCEHLLPARITSDTTTVNLHDLFEQAKTSARVDPEYKNDIRAGRLDPEAQGMYLMQDMPEPIAVEQTSRPNSYKGFDGRLWVDVYKIVEPFIASRQFSAPVKPSTYQSDGVTDDVPGVSRVPPVAQSISAAPAVPAVPAR